MTIIDLERHHFIMTTIEPNGTEDNLKTLFLIRHGASDQGFPDRLRVLNPDGKTTAQRVGQWLLNRKMNGIAAVASPASRAWSTASHIMKVLGRDPNQIDADDRIYEATVEQLIEVVGDLSPDKNEAMLVGHNPGLSQLVISLSGDFVHMSPGTLVMLTWHGDWHGLAVHDVTLQEVVVPRQLPVVFPAHRNRGDVLERPAYQYRQSGVMPYRWHEGLLQLMIITSRRKKNWIVPKGIAEPYLTPQESARREAVEEAGVDGVVAEHSLGRYHRTKWGGVCTVDIFPMRVTQVLTEDEWEESFRQRRWVDVNEAAQVLKPAALRQMVAKLIDAVT